MANSRIPRCGSSPRSRRGVSSSAFPACRTSSLTSMSHPKNSSCSVGVPDVGGRETDGPLRRHSEMATRDAQVAAHPARHHGTRVVPGHPRRRNPRHAHRCPERTTDRRHVQYRRRSTGKRPGAPISGLGRIGTVEARTGRTDEPRTRAHDAGERRTRERPDAGERIEVWTHRMHHLPRGEHRLRRRTFRRRLRTGEP